MLSIRYNVETILWSSTIGYVPQWKSPAMTLYSEMSHAEEAGNLTLLIVPGLVSTRRKSLTTSFCNIQVVAGVRYLSQLYENRYLLAI